MIRDKKVEVRLNQEEFDCLEYISDTTNISKSNILRQAIKEAFQNSRINAKGILGHLFNMQTIVNQMHLGVTQENLITLTKEMNELWQYLS